MKERLSITRIAEHKIVLSTVPNGDGSVTILAEVVPVGFVISIR